MDLIRSYYYSSTKQELLIGVIALEAFFTFPFIICSFVVAGTANAGFNCVLTGFLNIALAAGSYHVIKNSKAPIAVSVVVFSCFSLRVFFLSYVLEPFPSHIIGRFSVGKFWDDDFVKLNDCYILGAAEWVQICEAAIGRIYVH